MGVTHLSMPRLRVTLKPSLRHVLDRFGTCTLWDHQSLPSSPVALPCSAWTLTIGRDWDHIWHTWYIYIYVELLTSSFWRCLMRDLWFYHTQLFTSTESCSLSCQELPQSLSTMLGNYAEEVCQKLWCKSQREKSRQYSAKIHDISQSTRIN